MKKYLIKDICKIFNGSTPSTNNKFFWNGSIAWITPKDLSTLKTRRISVGERNITQEGYNSCSTTLLPKNTVLLSSRAPIGYVAIADNELCTNQGFKSLVCDENIVDYNYLYYWLLSRADYLNAISTGSTFKELSKDKLENIEIYLPNLVEQHHIVNTIGSIDDLIENKQNIITKLREKSSLLFESFIKENKETKKYKLSDYCVFSNGYSYTGKELVNDSSVGMITIKNFDRNGGYKIDGIKPINPTKNNIELVKLFDLLVAHTDLTQNADIVGNTILVTSSNYEQLIFSMDIVKLSNISQPFDNFILYEILNRADFKRFALGFTSGTTVLHLSKKALQEYSFEFSYNEESIKKISNEISNIYHLISCYEKEINNLECIKLNYLNKFFG